MSESWSFWLFIIGLILLIAGVIIAIWLSVNNNKNYWYGVAVAGLGVLLLLIAFIIYVMYKEPTCPKPIQYIQPVSNSCARPIPPPQSCQKVEQSCPMTVPSYTTYQQTTGPSHVISTTGAPTSVVPPVYQAPSQLQSIYPPVVQSSYNTPYIANLN